MPCNIHRHLPTARLVDSRIDANANAFAVANGAALLSNATLLLAGLLLRLPRSRCAMN